MHNNNIHRTYIILLNSHKQRIEKPDTASLHPMENAPYFHLTAKISEQNQQMYITDVKIIITLLAVYLLI